MTTIVNQDCANLLTSQLIDLQERYNQEKSEVAKQGAYVNECYSQLGYVEAGLNYLPSFISSTFLPVDSQPKIDQYNQAYKEFKQKTFTFGQTTQLIEAKTKEVYTQIKGDLRSTNPCSDNLRSIDLLKNLQTQLNSTLMHLSRAETDEWWDGMTSNHSFSGHYNDMSSYWSNSRAANSIDSLNRALSEYNMMKSYSQQALPTLWGASDSLMQAELNEHSFFNYSMGSIGDWMSSRATLDTIRNISSHVRAIAAHVDGQLNLARINIKQELINKRKERMPHVYLDPAVEERCINEVIG